MGEKIQKKITVILWISCIILLCISARFLFILYVEIQETPNSGLRQPYPDLSETIEE